MQTVIVHDLKGLELGVLVMPRDFFDPAPEE
jgi:hypothetical protein